MEGFHFKSVDSFGRDLIFCFHCFCLPIMQKKRIKCFKAINKNEGETYQNSMPSDRVLLLMDYTFNFAAE